MSKTLKDILETQRKFSEEFFDADGLSEKEKIERHKTFGLALHSEVSQLADAVHYKDHRNIISPTNKQKILYESVDVLRYCLATLNLWNFSSEEIEDAFDARDEFLWDRKNKTKEKWSGQPVIIVDVDDVISEFRECFFSWLNQNFGLELSNDLPEYYYKGKAGNLTGEEAFMKFIDESKIRSIAVNTRVKESLSILQKKGYWIQLLTARPSDNLKCLYDTYFWLRQNDIPYNNIAFSFEKYRWLADKDFFKKNSIICTIDDSTKHAAEYAHHGIKTLVPKRSYNKSVWSLENVVTFDWRKDRIDEIV